jgi:hypothetical protein
VHQGPGQIYMSKAPRDDIENYKGDGDWFKVSKVGWESYGKGEVKKHVRFTRKIAKPLSR